jgi:CxxC motif-containing protein (DUF1111 family)
VRRGERRRPSAVSLSIVIAAAGLFAIQASLASQTRAQDPGVRADKSGVQSAGAALAGLTTMQTEYFTVGKADFEEAEELGDGIGPRMNLDSCVGCHKFPASGGSSPAMNPQIAFATQNGGRDTVPSFLSLNGPVREVRFVRNSDGTPDGGVHALFTITGRTDASLPSNGCSLAQPNFAGAAANNNVIFRIPTPVFGAGLIEQIPDAAIVANRSSSSSTKQALGIRGRPNFNVAGRTITGQTNNNGNDGTIARVGWKGQNKSLLLFAGEAYNVEMGITNELFQTERDETSACQYGRTPNSITNTEETSASAAMSSIEKFSHFMRFLDAPKPAGSFTGASSFSIANGKSVFNNVGCALCHTPSMKTGASAVAALSQKNVNLFSDLLIHDMGDNLADGVSQGSANGREFRTAPLWGLGQRIFFLHDGRTSNLISAIRAHASNGSEANGVVNNFLNLGEGSKQDLLNFLRSL